MFRANLSGKRTEFDEPILRYWCSRTLPLYLVLQSQIMDYDLAFRFAAIKKGK